MIRTRWNSIAAVRGCNKAIEGAIEEIEALLGEKSYGWHREFAAIVVAKRLSSCSPSLTYDRFYKESVICEAWVGDEQGILATRRDYLSNCGHKVFSSVRTGMPNSVLLHDRRELLVASDSLWPGTAVSDGFVFGTSGQLPPEDEWISEYGLCSIQGLPRPGFSRLTIEKVDYSYKRIYPVGGEDLVGGMNFNQPPDFWWQVA